MHIRRFLVTLIRRSLFVLLLVCLGCVAQSTPPDVARKVEHQVRAFYNVPAEVKVTVGAITPGGDLPGYDTVAVTLDGQGKQKEYKFLLSKDRNTMLRVTKFDLTKDAFTELMSKIDVAGRPTRGAKNAKVVVVNFDDFECPFCARMHQTLFPDALKEYGDRVTFIQESAVATTRGPADLVLCVGSSHALTEVQPPGHTAAALGELRRLVTPGGRVLLAEGFWHRTPTEAELADMWPGTAAGEFGDLPGLVDPAVAAGFRPAWIETATLEEWEDFESGYQCDEEEWLAAHADHPEAARIREQVDRHRSFWLRGYYGLLGQAYLTLVPVG